MLHHDADDKCVRALYAEHGKRGRDLSQGPAWWGIDDGLETAEYLANDEFHRDEADGPAIITCDLKSGAVLNEVYYKCGVLHRQGGPALTARDPDGSTIIEEYWIEGEWCEP